MCLQQCKNSYGTNAKMWSKMIVAHFWRNLTLFLSIRSEMIVLKWFFSTPLFMKLAMTSPASRWWFYFNFFVLYLICNHHTSLWMHDRKINQPIQITTMVPDCGIMNQLMNAQIYSSFFNWSLVVEQRGYVTAQYEQGDNSGLKMKREDYFRWTGATQHCKVKLKAEFAQQLGGGGRSGGSQTNAAKGTGWV